MTRKMTNAEFPAVAAKNRMGVARHSHGISAHPEVDPVAAARAHVVGRRTNRDKAVERPNGPGSRAPGALRSLKMRSRGQPGVPCKPLLGEIGGSTAYSESMSGYCRRIAASTAARNAS